MKNFPFAPGLPMSRFLVSCCSRSQHSCSPAPASAAYPDRVIKIVVPFAPGGGTDAVARMLAQEMAKDLGASVIIENKPGAGTISAPSWSRPASRTATRC